MLMLHSREYAEEEDARRQKIAQEVIEGKYKGKRRDGLDGVLSSDEDDDEDKRLAKRKWRQMLKKRAIGEDLEGLGMKCLRR
jgi:mediator of replication checkpoint protein 1